MLAKLIRYTAVADALVIDTFLKSGKSLEQAEKLFSHILNAQHIWSSRINGVKPEYTPWDVHPLSYFGELHEINTAQIRQILTSDELERTVSYTTFTGASLENSVADILLHIANHSTYHRAQVASCFKQNDIQPPATDLIALKLQGLL